MPLTDAGILQIAKDINGEGVTDFNAANAYLGVGDSSTAFAKAQTDLQASSNKYRQGMDATFPSRSGLIITAQITVLPANANYAWNEWGYFNDPSAGVMLNRRVVSLGTKPSTQTWVLTVTLTFNDP